MDAGTADWTGQVESVLRLRWEVGPDAFGKDVKEGREEMQQMSLLSRIRGAPASLGALPRERDHISHLPTASCPGTFLDATAGLARLLVG